MNEDELLKRKVLDTANQAFHHNIYTYTNFLSISELAVVTSFKKELSFIRYDIYGGNSVCERQLIRFGSPEDYGYDAGYPITTLKISPLSVKFAEKLEHRDYLGALLNLGVDRSVIGDIVVQEKAAWFFCQNKMTEFFLENLCRVRHTNILITKVEDSDEFPRPVLESVSGTCASVRLDSLISLAFKTSRSSMVSYIEGGQVFVNGKLITSNGYEPKDGDIISVRGKGRFIFDGVSHQTKKGRCSVRIMRYV